MRRFNYSSMPPELMHYEIMNLISAIHEYKGKQELYIKSKPDILDSLLDIARIQSTGASNRIEGIHTSEKRLKDLMDSKAEPLNRSEKEIAGYREVLKLIHENYEFMTPVTGVILQLHRDLYQFNLTAQGGRYKNNDNVITETNLKGEKIVRFKPLSAFETPDAMERLTASFLKAIEMDQYDPLLLIPMFILDFLCIHPFSDGNGRISRLLTLLLLYRAGYIVGKFISMEMIIEKTKETYYETLLKSSVDWEIEKNDYAPFVKYYLEIILSSYREFSDRVELVQNRGMSKQERIRHLFDESLHPLSKKMILDKYPDISKPTVQLALASLLKEGVIRKLGTGKNTKYVKIF